MRSLAKNRIGRRPRRSKITAKANGPAPIPPLSLGDHLSEREFLRRYEAMPHLKPELVAEVALSSVNYDLHEKLKAYQENGIPEYLVWRVSEKEFDWFLLHAGKYRKQKPTRDILKSRVFPGLWLDVAALVSSNLRKVLDLVNQGLATSEHERYRAKLGNE